MGRQMEPVLAFMRNIIPGRRIRQILQRSHVCTRLNNILCRYPLNWDARGILAFGWCKNCEIRGRTVRINKFNYLNICWIWVVACWRCCGSLTRPTASSWEARSRGKICRYPDLSDWNRMEIIHLVFTFWQISTFLLVSIVIDAKWLQCWQS